MPDDEREHVLTHLYRVFHEDLHLCGCGNPETAWVLIHELLKLAPFYENERWRRALELIGSDGAHHIVLSALTGADLIEHGGGIGGSWLTGKGRWMLQALGAFDMGEIDGLVDEVGLPHEGRACVDDCWTIRAGR